MADRIGICTNYTGCTLAYRKEKVSVAGEFVCPECGSPLNAPAPAKAPSSALPLVFIILGAVLVLTLFAVGGVVAIKALGRKKAPIVAVKPTPTPSPKNLGTPPPARTPTLAVATPPPLATPPPVGTPPPAATPKTMPDSTPVIAAATPERELPMPTPDLDPDSAANKQVKQDVLKRIDLMPNLNADQKDKLYAHLERARGIVRAVTVPFDTGKKTLSAAQSDRIKEAMQKPEVVKLLNDPTVVFVVLGYADTKGDEQKNLSISLARADSVISVLQQKAGLRNVMHSVAMGSSDLFDPTKLEKNRIAEVWAVLP